MSQVLVQREMVSSRISLIREQLANLEKLAAEAEEVPVSLADAERRHIERVLQSVGGNKSEAARLLGIDRKTLQRKGF